VPAVRKVCPSVLYSNETDEMPALLRSMPVTICVDFMSMVTTLSFWSVKLVRVEALPSNRLA